MPEPLGRSQRYMPGLDGLRAVAVLAVIAYHLGFSWAPGGLLGVGVFFTLSGYLITDLLLAQRSSGRMRLADFWLARARRLLPALFLMLAVVVVWVVAIGPGQTAEFRNAVIAAAIYVANWQLIFQHVSYFASFGPPSPLNHLWSLGVEEQFYIVWPLLLLLGLRFIRERSPASGRRPRLAAVTLLLAAGSAAEMALLYRPTLDPSRIYFGTDTRAFELLAGAALAMVWPSRALRQKILPGARRTLDAIGAVGLLAILALIWRTSQYSAFLYRGGFVLLSVATVLVLAALAHPACRLGRVLSFGPLRWTGVRSYGIYLWHVPIVVPTTPAADHGISLGRDALQVAATFIVAALSWRFVEQPIRHGALGRLWKRARNLRWELPPLARSRAFAVPIALLALVSIAGGVGLAAIPGPRPSPRSRITAVIPSAWTSTHRTTGDATATKTKTSTTRAMPARGGGPPLPPTSPATGGALAPAVGAALAGVSHDPSTASSSCRAVIHIGDSTSEGLTSPDYLPDASERIEAQYADVGVTTQHYEISGARSIVETYEGQPNGYQVATAWKHAGYRGCWVLALGTNDTANVYVGSNVGRLARIQRMMSVIGNQPVMWVNLKSLLTSGPYSEQNMQLWNEALADACHEHPNMHIFDWASVVQDSWFINDGIHYNTPGYAARAHLIAQALARAFPQTGHSSGCLVR
jgi:peptidoglycan/LPS O-acetylase OafA/YrhL